MFSFGFSFIYENLIQPYVPKVKQATTFYKGEKVISYTISFKLEVFVVAEKKTISTAAF